MTSAKRTAILFFIPFSPLSAQALWPPSPFILLYTVTYFNRSGHFPLPPHFFRMTPERAEQTKRIMQDYDRFVALCTLTPQAAAAQRRAVLFAAPRFAVIETTGGGDHELRQSLAEQTYGKYILSDLSRRPEADYYLFLPGASRLAPECLYRLAAAAGGGRELLYADEDVLIRGRRRHPRFKPAFSPYTLLGYDYLGRGVCVSRALLLAVGGWPGPTAARRYAFWLRAVSLAERVAHLPFVLFSLPPEDPCADPGPLKSALGRDALLLPGPVPGTFLPRFGVRGKPLVSVVATDEAGSDALKSTLLAVEQRMQLPRYEFVVAAGRPLTPFLEALKSSGATVLTRPAASPAALWNEAARAARGRFLLFLAGGCVPLSPDFGQRLTEWADRPDVGAVGPLVLDKEDRILSLGTVAGLYGGLGSPGFGLTRGALVRACPRLLCPRNVSCLPPWALMIRRDRFLSAGGFDASLGRLGYAEELCLRLSRRGLSSLFAPGVRFRLPALNAPDPDATNLRRCRDVFYPLLRTGDPYYNPNLSMTSPLPRPALPPRPPLLLHIPDRWPPYAPAPTLPDSPL